MELVEWKEAKRKGYAIQATRLDFKNNTKRNMEKIKLPKLLKQTQRSKKRKSYKGPWFYQKDESKKRKGIDANKETLLKI